MKIISDILVIGAGITGCAVARELSGYQASVIVLEKENDLAEGATKANSGIVHAGYDAVPGSLKAFYNIRGASMYPELCASLGLPYQQCGALVIALNEKDRQTVELLRDRGEKNGVSGLRILEHNELLSLEPALNPQVVCALYVPSSALISPYETAFAIADHAALNGVSFRLNQKVLSVQKNPDGLFSVQTESGEYLSRILVNCAGTSGAFLHNQLSADKLDMVYRRGQYYLLDHEKKLPFTHTVFQCPSAMGKGVLVTPTVHGNLLLGPTAEDIDDPMDTATTAEGLQEVFRKAALTWPDISIRTNITNFSGVRAHLTTDDFVVGPCSDCPGYYEAIGIESPGLSSAPAIAKDLSAMIAEELGLQAKEEMIPFQVPAVSFRDMTEEEKSRAVAEDPAYGNIVCRCETVTEAEIRAAIRRPVGARTIDGVKRRTRAGMGRCQGGFCMPRVADIIAEETGVSLLDIRKDSGNSYILSGTVESFLKRGAECDDSEC
ncbi:MAG: NAD(P)/FAD-dependent oxidoreductase [Clostridia bacterium]|nr:NAD(P)/FAD-dependent oxidoreductase [Clostridia bacterium]